MGETNSIEVDQFANYTERGGTLGLRCTIALAQSLLDRADPEIALRHLHDLLVSTSSDPGLDTFRAVALRGEHVGDRIPETSRESMNAFATRCRAGLGGVSESGTILAWSIPGKAGPLMMICQLGFGIVRPDRNPAVVLTTVEAANFYIESIASRSKR